MDALEFIELAKEFAEVTDNEFCKVLNSGTPEYVLKFLEKWRASRFAKTRQSELLKLFPDATVDKVGILVCAPCELFSELEESCGFSRHDYEDCVRCRELFWLEEVGNG